MLNVWDLESGEEVQSISCVFHGPVAAATWISMRQVGDKGFVFGCADGTLHVYRRPGDVSATTTLLVSNTQTVRSQPMILRP